MEIEKKIVLSEEEYNQLMKDRLDFGFDSIYFRYSEAIDQLEHCGEINHTQGQGKKMHFYMTLEQLVHAHEVNDNGTY